MYIRPSPYKGKERATDRVLFLSKLEGLEVAGNINLDTTSFQSLAGLQGGFFEMLETGAENFELYWIWAKKFQYFWSHFSAIRQVILGQDA